MKSIDINIVSFNIPYPPNYGGIIDVYYKIKSLHDLGIKIYLHCFDYGRGIQNELESICTKVYYYKRNTGVLKAFSRLPYIVNSRLDKQLLTNLLQNDFPILFEGLHTTCFLQSQKLKDRIKIVRTHNVEHDYYNLLYRQEQNLFKRLYFKIEALKLTRYESVLKNASLIASISLNDTAYFTNKYKNVFWLPPFHPNTKVNIELGNGNYALYHGNLSVVENIKAALFLIDAFKNKTNLSIIFAGKNPDKEIVALVNSYENFKIIANPSNKEMQNLIVGAHVHLLPTFQPTGIKLKLIASLFSGKHCIANDEMIDGTGLEKLCHRANLKYEFVEKTHKLMKIPFEDKDLILRNEILSKKFENQRNAELLLSKIDNYILPKSE